MRNLKDAGGNDDRGAAGVRALPRQDPDRHPGDREAAAPTWSSVFGELEGAGIGRSNLYMAWDFTVASSAT